MRSSNPEQQHSVAHLAAWQGVLSAERFSIVSDQLLILYCLSSALSIVLAQIFILPLLAYYIAHMLAMQTLRSETRSHSHSEHGFLSEARLAMICWLVTALLASLLGVNPAHSLSDFSKTALYLLLPFCVLRSLTAIRLPRRTFVSRIRGYLLSLVVGQAIASFHTIVSTALGTELPPNIPGAVTESGQLVLLIPCVLALLVFPTFQEPVAFRKSTERQQQMGLSIALFLALLLFAWPEALHFTRGSTLALTLQTGAFLLALLFAFRLRRCIHQSPQYRLLRFDTHFTEHIQAYLFPLAAVLSCALLLNLKRGPWMGVALELLVIGLIFSRRTFFALVLIAAILLSVLGPARARLANSDEDFSIVGGRQTMWELGTEMVQRYPLGVGLGNVRYMRELDPTLPAMHRHMHNNLLNMAVELGWLGLAAFLWWMFVYIRGAIRHWQTHRKNPSIYEMQLGLLALCLGLSLAGWQVAGLVEYNFGDGEIRVIALFFMGLLLALSAQQGEKDGTKKSNPIPLSTTDV